MSIVYLSKKRNREPSMGERRVKEKRAMDVGRISWRKRARQRDEGEGE